MKAETVELGRLGRLQPDYELAAVAAAAATVIDAALIELLFHLTTRRYSEVLVSPHTQTHTDLHTQLVTNIND